MHPLHSGLTIGGIGGTHEDRTNVFIAVAILALGIGGVAFAGIANRAATSTTEVDITLTDGKLKVSPISFTEGKVILVVTNKGKVAHALAIMGTGLQVKHTPTLRTGKSATLKLTLGSGRYHVWDTLTSSMSRANDAHGQRPEGKDE